MAGTWVSASRSLAAAASGMLLLSVGVHGVSAAGATQRQSVVFYGDSLAFQSSAYLKRNFNPTTMDAYLHLYPGTAICDWFTQINQLTRRNPPDVVVLQFIGNHGTQCIKTSKNFVAQYGRDLRSVVARLREVGVLDIVVDAGPTTPAAPWWSSLVTTYRRVITSFHSTAVVYAGPADNSVESPTGRFVATLQCLPVEVKYHKCVAGSLITVRASDKVHFCPQLQPEAFQACSTYASGAYRFAHGLAREVWNLDPKTQPSVGT